MTDSLEYNIQYAQKLYGIEIDEGKAKLNGEIIAEHNCIKELYKMILQWLG